MRLVLAGSRFCSDAESRYSAVEGELACIVWALNSTKYFTIGNDHLVVSTDHKPLLAILEGKPLDNIANPRLSNLREKTVRWRFYQVIHTPGKENSTPDALSRRPVGRADEPQARISAILAGCMTRPLSVTTKDMAAATGNCLEASLLQKIVKSSFPTKIGKSSGS